MSFAHKLATQSERAHLLLGRAKTGPFGIPELPVTFNGHFTGPPPTGYTKHKRPLSLSQFICRRKLSPRANGVCKTYCKTRAEHNLPVEEEKGR